MLNMKEIRKGRVIVLDGEPYLVAAAEFSRKQKSRPVVRAQVKHLKTGKTREHTFMQSDKVEEADLSRRKLQFLYGGENVFVFMDQVSYEQLELPAEIVGGAGRLLLEGQEVEVLLFADEPVTLELPIKIERKVVTAPPGVKGDTSTNVMKEVEIEGGATIKAPLFC